MLGRDFPGGPVIMNPPSKEGDTGSIPVSSSTCCWAAKPMKRNYRNAPQRPSTVKSKFKNKKINVREEVEQLKLPNTANRRELFGSFY